MDAGGGTDNNHEFEQCGNSTLSAHFFSPNGSTWFNLATRPYDHTVHCELPPGPAEPHQASGSNQWRDTTRTKMQDRTYPRRVADDDGTSHTYTTLERPNLHFDSAGQLTHINLAADLVTGDEGCADRSKRHSHFGHIPCDNCKWDDHAGTVIIALDTTPSGQ